MCPSLAMMWDLGATIPKMRILKEKLLLYRHLKFLSLSSLGRKVLEIQEEFYLPSPHEDIKPFLSKYSILDVLSFSKNEWRNFVREKVSEENRLFLLDGMKKYKKVSSLDFSLEEFVLKA